jgi:hypothetical protein
MLTNGRDPGIIELETAIIYYANGKYHYSVTNKQQAGAAPLLLTINNLSKRYFKAVSDETTISFRRRGQRAFYNREDGKNKVAKTEKITFRIEEAKLPEGKIPENPTALHSSHVLPAYLNPIWGSHRVCPAPYPAK